MIEDDGIPDELDAFRRHLEQEAAPKLFNEPAHQRTRDFLRAVIDRA